MSGTEHDHDCSMHTCWRSDHPANCCEDAPALTPAPEQAG